MATTAFALVGLVFLAAPLVDVAADHHGALVVHDVADADMRRAAATPVTMAIAAILVLYRLIDFLQQILEHCLFPLRLSKCCQLYDIVQAGFVHGFFLPDVEFVDQAHDAPARLG